ncbi:MAG: lysylphosphatidylglycerol synthase transmembrane domain-containing protein [Polyangia bacterium]
MRRYVKLLGFALLAYILWRADVGALGETLAACRLDLVAAGFSAGLFAIAIKALRWRSMLLRQGHDYGAWRSVKVYAVGIYAGIATPGRLGELSRVLYLRRDIGVGVGAGLSSVVVDRVLDLYFLVAVGIAAAYRFGVSGDLSFAIAVTAAALALLPVVALHPRAGRWLARRATSLLGRTRLGRGLADSTEEFYDGVETLLSAWLLIGALTTAAAYATFFLAAHLLALSVGIDIAPADTALTVGLANLASLVPITVAGVGTRDAIFVLAFASLGLAEAQALAFSALVLAVFYLLNGLVGFAFFLADPPPPPETTAPDTGDKPC